MVHGVLLLGRRLIVQGVLERWVVEHRSLLSLLFQCFQLLPPFRPLGFSNLIIHAWLAQLFERNRLRVSKLYAWLAQLFERNRLKV